MDKNFVNIDDLVRQRLLGGEEREAAGAWDRMSKLLNEEMPERKAILFPWRRLFGGLAILLLLGGLSVGGYELNAYAHRGNGNAVVVSASAPATTLHAKGTTSSNSMPDATADNTQNTTATKSTSPNADNTQNTPDNNNTVNSNSGNHSRSLVVANVNHKTHQAPGTHIRKSATVAHISTSIAKNESATQVPTGNTTAASITPDAVSAPAETKVAANDKHHHRGVHKIASSAMTNEVAADEEGAGSKTHEPAVAKTTSKAAENTRSVAEKSTIAKTDVATKKEPSAGKSTTENATTGKPSDTKDAVAGTSGNEHVKKHGTVGKHTLALAGAPSVKGKISTTALHKTESKATGAVKSTSPVKPGKVALAGTSRGVSPAAKTTGVKSMAKTGAVKGTSPTASVTKSKSAHKTGSAKTAAPAVVNPDDDSNPVADGGGQEVQKVKRTIPQLIVHERISSSAPGTAFIHMDTISFADITEYYDLPAYMLPGAAKKSNNGAADAPAGAPAPAAAPGAAKPKSSSSDDESGSKENNFVKKSKGKMALENLAAAFNDIKYKAGHAQFAGGVTGGVNGTFLGPNTFKGFQFGMFGKFMFSDVLVLMGEFKYYHRINTGYTLDDDYYNYTPAAGGGYSKELVRNPYGISTLHSLELPITVRYAIGNFNFFVGPNLLYTFAINTGDYPTVVPTNTPVIVQTIGNDNTPKIKSNDFGSRFGIGSVFGASYDISNKVTIDVRDVQTFWDNARTTGSKFISSQLFRSPSFQMSLLYRFGGGKKEGKDQ